jgi:Fe2+ transport system protein B
MQECSRHGIRRDVLEQIVLTKIQETVAEALCDREKFARKISRASSRENERALKTKTAEIVKAERRIAELDKIIKRIYEDNINGRLSDERFDKLLKDYEAEQRELNESLAILQETVETLKAQSANLDSFFKLAERHAEIPELTAEAARTFIKRIVVHEPVKKPGTRLNLTQKVDIYFNHIGMNGD